MAVKLKSEPPITVGILDRQGRVEGRFNGTFRADGIGPLAGRFSARAEPGTVVLFDGANREAARSPSIRVEGGEGSTFELFDVTIGGRFHWERRENQTFEGNLILRSRPDGTLAAINEVSLEAYLMSVISSEMSASAPAEFLKTHAILSRSWLLAALQQGEGHPGMSGPAAKGIEEAGEIVRWYGREEHDLYDVCADDHCQRYHGVTKITSAGAGRAVRETRGVVLFSADGICDARYSKACGGRTEEFATAWHDAKIPYLVSVADGPVDHPPIATEGQADLWCASRPRAYCNTRDASLLEKILPSFDRETGAFFRWTVEYPRRELEEIVGEKSGYDFGRLQAIEPLTRGPSGRIARLRIVGSKMSMIVGKELEIRRWLSRSHLYSSAFTVRVTPGADGEAERFTLRGAGWGHGVGLCQIGAAVMADKGSGAREIMGHYFPRADLVRLY
ncbi:MAG: SpoIID/LytB domain-containing protein [Syntrophorhabdales bacterium]